MNGHEKWYTSMCRRTTTWKQFFLYKTPAKVYVSVILLKLSIMISNKKLSYRRGTARCVVSIEILPAATQQCRNYLYDKS